MKNFNEYRKYRWFYTSTGKLVVGGKSSGQNDLLIGKLKSSDHDFVMMHTSSPGSPFSVVVSDIKNVTRADKFECAAFTACFSQMWKLGKKKASVHIFKSSQLYKSAGMKQGTWGITGDVEKVTVPLKLALIRQNSVLRAVPLKSVKNKKNILLILVPGNADKIISLPDIKKITGEETSQSEILSAVPAGGIKILR